MYLSDMVKISYMQKRHSQKTCNQYLRAKNMLGYHSLIQIVLDLAVWFAQFSGLRR